jgi:Ser/Thr protein kinase RdoA (MazF antagonist)
MAPGPGTNQNAQVDQQDEPVLATDEIQSVERILSETWDEPSTLRSAEPVWGRRHVVRVVTTSGQAAFVKRPRKPRDVERDENNFAADWSALAFLSDAPGAPVPRVLGGDWPRRLLVIEELPPGRSLAESLLGDDPWAAGNDLVAYAEALARTHLWSLERLEEYKDARAARGLADQPLCGWAHTVDQENQAAFTAVIRELGVADAELQAELEAELEALYDWLFDGPFLGLVHGDPCPDNVRIVDGICRLFDFEVSGLGSIALDTTYLRAPFPSCWCFGALPSDVADRAASAYEAVLVNGGVRLGAEWQDATAAALALWVVARWRMLRRALGEDWEWGTTTMRPRLVAWSRAATRVSSTRFVRLGTVIGDLADLCAERWPEAAIPQYPALASGAPVAKRPVWFDDSRR